MKRFQAYAAKCNACKLLLIASSVWFLLLMCLYNYDWSSDLSESTEYGMVGAEDQTDEKQRNFAGEVLFTGSRIAEKEFKVEAVAERKSNKVLKVKSKKTSYEKLVTPVPPHILKELGLKNPGDKGKPVKLVNVSAEIQKKIDKGWRRHQFNEFVSDLISVKRVLPDPRDEYCKRSNLYLEELPSTSVIVIFHNEAWSTLLRTVHSVFDRSPEHLIKEIILVDDFSNMGKAFQLK